MATLTPEVLKERLEEARRTYKLNVGYFALTELPEGFVDLVKKYNPHIMELELSSNKLSDLPEDILAFQYLRVVRLKYNNLRRIPEVLHKLPQLMILELAGNAIEAIDEEIAALPHLQELDLSGNHLLALPESISKAPSLQVLQLENNAIEQLPESFGDFKNLVKVDISTNQLRTLPESMGQLRKVQRIDAANNMIVRVPPCMGHLKTLKEFNLRYNNLSDAYRAKTDEGLSKFLAFLREEEERERLEEIERLKPIGTHVGSYYEYRCKAEAAQEVKNPDGSISTVDNRCWIRSGHAITQVGSHLYLFGGLVTKDGTKSNDVFWMTTDRMEWHLQSTKGERPCPRDHHCMVHDPEANTLVVFGGRSNDRKRLADVFVLDLATWTWSKAQCEGNPPAPREMAAATYWAGHMVIFGGHAVGARKNDIFFLDLHDMSWSPLTAELGGSPPSPRQDCAMCVANGMQIFVSGGRNNFVLEDLYVLDMLNKNWTQVNAQGRAPPPRYRHLLCHHGENLYFYGGYNDLGAASDVMFRLPVRYGDNLAMSRPTWEEIATELPYNRHRTYTAHDGQLSIYQLGSTTLGKVNEEEAEKGTVWWDVFKFAKLGDLRGKVLDEEALRPKNAKRLRVQHTINTAHKMPSGCTTTTAVERAALNYCGHFQAAFTELYPQRRPLFLCPLNECSVRKFAPTTLRPTQLPYTDLYDLEGVAQFVSDFLTYEPLEDPLHPPEYFPSPMSVLSWQAGDCVDVSAVLCSLLLGVGYDAYVVMGYAPRSVTLNDQAHTECPAVEKERLEAAAEEAKRNAPPPPGEKPKYAVKGRIRLVSDFDVQQEEMQKAKRAEQQKQYESLQAEARGDGEAGAPGAGRHTAREDAEDEHAGHRVHAWVLVRAGKRDVVETVFIEPSTGRRYLPSDCPYTGVEWCWNAKNFWVCRQMPEPHSDARAVTSKISYELGDPEKWEQMLPDALALGQSHGQAAAAAGEEDGDGEGGGTTPIARQKSKTAGRSLAGAGGQSVVSRGSTIGGPGGTSRVQARALSRKQMSTVSASEQGGSQDGDGGSSDVDVLPDVPVSWVPKLVIPRDMFDMRCPKGQKSTKYHKCQRDIYAYFGECAEWNGLVERITIYVDEARTQTAQIWERYMLRKDKLVERRVDNENNTEYERFEPGSYKSLKDITRPITKGERREMNFYHAARLDCLKRRVELIGKKTIETFEGRDDRLVYRSVTYGERPPDEEDLGRPASRAKSRREGGGQEKKFLPIVKMTEKFAADATGDLETQVAKRTYYLSQEMIRLDYHYGPDRITHSSRVYTKDGQTHIVQVDPLADQPRASELLEEFQALQQAEKDCATLVRDNEWEVLEITDRRLKDAAAGDAKHIPYADIVRHNPNASDDEEEEATEAEYDYLSPFLPLNHGTKPIDRALALRIRESCLKALKDRLIERANIIQARHDEETAALAKRQANFQRDRDQMTREEEDEYESACEESMFRIRILEKRLKRHEEQALSKYYDLDAKLRRDPRLAVLLEA